MKKILIYPRNCLGDAVLALPLAGLIKESFPDTTVAFITNLYANAVVKKSRFVDEWYGWEIMQDDLINNLRKIKADTIIHLYSRIKMSRAAYKANIPIRIGYARRFYHLLYCNRYLWFTRNNSNLHEAQLNVKLLAPLGIKELHDADSLINYYGWQKTPLKKFEELLPDKHNIILHPKTNDHLEEWHSKIFLN